MLRYDKTYKDAPGLFAISAALSVLSTALSVGLGSAIVVSEVAFAPGLAIAIAIAGGVVIGFFENDIRKWLLE